MGLFNNPSLFSLDIQPVPIQHSSSTLLELILLYPLSVFRLADQTSHQCPATKVQFGFEIMFCYRIMSFIGKMRQIWLTLNLKWFIKIFLLRNFLPSIYIFIFRCFDSTVSSSILTTVIVTSYVVELIEFNSNHIIQDSLDPYGCFTDLFLLAFKF